MPVSINAGHRTPPPLRILCVQDNPTLGRAVAEVLRGAGHQLETAGDGAEGLKKLVDAATERGTPFDLLITDLNLPAIDGVRLIQLLRKTDRRIRVMVYSSFISPPRVSQLRALDVDAFMDKGIPVNLLVEAVAKLPPPRS